MSEWRTMDSAPKDGTIIQCFVPFGPGNCCAGPHGDGMIWTCAWHYKSGDDPEDRSKYQWIGAGVFGTDVPTLWMPMPDKPSRELILRSMSPTSR